MVEEREAYGTCYGCDGFLGLLAGGNGLWASGYVPTVLTLFSFLFDVE